MYENKLSKTRVKLVVCGFFSAITNISISGGDKKSLEVFQAQLSHRKVWIASSIHKGEEEGTW